MTQKFVFPSRLNTGDTFDPSQLTTNPYAAEDRAVMEAAQRQKAQERGKARLSEPPPSSDGGIANSQEQEGATGTGDPSAEQIAAESEGSVNPFGGEPWVLRSPRTEYKIPYGATNPYAGAPAKGYTSGINAPTIGGASTLDLYTAEYQKRILDDKDGAFKDWLSKRSAVLFGDDLRDKDGNFDFIKGADSWGKFGYYTASNPYLQESMTPEEYADKMYEQGGGDTAYDAFAESKAKANAAENPIRTVKTVSTSTMNNSAAEAAVDDLARGLLGRMGGDKELARYRKQINAFLKANPTVTTEVQDATDPANVRVTNTRKEGASPTDAVNVLEMKMRRGSEGMAFNIGQMFDEALVKMDRSL